MVGDGLVKATMPGAHARVFVAEQGFRAVAQHAEQPGGAGPSQVVTVKITGTGVAQSP
jgi:hypothetical protein